MAPRARNHLKTGPEAIPIVDRPSDDAVLAAWCSGDREAARILVDRYYADLLRFFRGKVGDDADDLIQQTLLACFEAVDRRSEMSTFRAYLFGIARHRLVDHFRQRDRHSAAFDPREHSLVDAAASPSAVVADRDEHRLLANAMRSIPLDLQIVLELYYWEQMTAAELGAVLEVPEGTVRGRVRRAKEAVREQMEGAGASDRVVRGALGDLARPTERSRT